MRTEAITPLYAHAGHRAAIEGVAPYAGFGQIGYRVGNAISTLMADAKVRTALEWVSRR